MSQLPEIFKQTIDDDANPVEIKQAFDSIRNRINNGMEADNIAAGAVTDEKIGSRTIDDAINDEATNTSTLTKLLSWLAKQIKAVIGGENWYASPPINLTEIKSKVTAQEEFNALLSDHLVSGNHDERYYTKAELSEYLTGGNTDIVYEVFNIVSSDNGDGTFSYKNKDDMIINAPLGESGEQTFYLEAGAYIPGENRIELWVNDTLHRSVASGGLEEVETGDAVILTAPEGIGAEITIKYFVRVALAGQYSIIMSETMPALSDDDKLWFEVVG